MKHVWPNNNDSDDNITTNSNGDNDTDFKVQFIIINSVAKLIDIVTRKLGMYVQMRSIGMYCLIRAAWIIVSVLVLGIMSVIYYQEET